MKIKFTDGSVGHFKLWHEYSSYDRQCIKGFATLLEQYTETHEILHEVARQYSERVDFLAEWYEEQISHLKGEITRHKQRPIKTHCTFEYQDTKVEAFSSISQEDAGNGLHSRKTGRQTAIRKLLNNSQITVPKEVRTELAKALMHLIK